MEDETAPREETIRVRAKRACAISGMPKAPNWLVASFFGVVGVFGGCRSSRYFVPLSMRSRSLATLWIAVARFLGFSLTSG